MFLLEAAKFHEVVETFVALFLEVAVEEAEGVDLFGLGIDLGILAERRVEGLELHDGLLLEVDVAIHLRRGEEDDVVDEGGGGADAVDGPRRCMRRVAFHGVS